MLTHALGDPQIDRAASVADNPDHALRIVGRDADGGLTIRGAKQLTTLAPYAHEVLVYLSASFAQREAEDFVLWVALPINTPGLHVLAREPFGLGGHGHAHPLGARFDEQDAMLFFDDVHVPADRVLLLRDGRLALEGLGRINAWSQYVGQVRYRERLRTLLGVATLIADAIGVSDFRNIQEDLGELTSYVEVLGHLLDAGEATARVTDSGHVAPGPTPAGAIWSAEVARRSLDIVRSIGQSGVLMQPTERDLTQPELRPLLERYMHGRDIGVDEKSRLFRLAWDLTADSFGQRQDLYEVVHRGDVARNRINLFRRHDQSDVQARLRALIAEPLGGGDGMSILDRARDLTGYDEIARLRQAQDTDWVLALAADQAPRVRARPRLRDRHAAGPRAGALAVARARCRDRRPRGAGRRGAARGWRATRASRSGAATCCRCPDAGRATRCGRLDLGPALALPGRGVVV